jgi:proteic killer suppression protein
MHTLYEIEEGSRAVIKSFKHSGLEKFYRTGSKSGIIPEHAKKLGLLLGFLNVATKPGDMGAKAWGLHPLKGHLEGHWAVKVNGNWRLTFRFVNADAEVVDYQDYH